MSEYLKSIDLGCKLHQCRMHIEICYEKLEHYPPHDLHTEKTPQRNQQHCCSLPGCGECIELRFLSGEVAGDEPSAKVVAQEWYQDSTDGVDDHQQGWGDEGLEGQKI